MACFGLAHEETVKTVSAFATETLNGMAKNDNAATPTPAAFTKIEFFISISPSVKFIFYTQIQHLPYTSGLMWQLNFHHQVRLQTANIALADCTLTETATQPSKADAILINTFFFPCPLIQRNVRCL
jgi:hypothetical protein